MDALGKKHLGTAPLLISSIRTTGPFTRTSNCPIQTTLLARDCTITVTYHATAIGLQTGSLIVTDNGSGSPHTLPLTGTGIGFLALGSFVVGDESAEVGSTVTFWGAHWSEDNRLSSGPAPATSKVYADTLQTNPPTCGQPWSADPATSSDPPDTLPPFIGVIVARHITRDGSRIGGAHIAQIVAVETNPATPPIPAIRALGRSWA